MIRTPSPIPSAAHPPERCWSLARAGQLLDCVLLHSNTFSWECAIFDADWCVYRRRWATYPDGLIDAEVQREALLREGWTLAK